VGREIWLGPIMNRNRARLVGRCREMLRAGRGREFLYLAASKPLLDTVTGALLDGEIAGTIEPLNVHLLSGFSRRVLTSARFVEGSESLPYFQPIDREQRPLQRPLLARIIARLAETKRLKSFGPLARTEGVVSSMASLIGEIQRAGKTAAEFRAIVERRETLDRESKPARELPVVDAPPDASEVSPVAPEPARVAALDYDRDTALIYEQYEAILDRYHLTDASHDFLRALAVLRGEFEARAVRVPFLDEARLLIVDGFFDLLPVHSETLQVLVSRFAETIVNLNFDKRNEEAYSPFADVVERFKLAGKFTEVYTEECHGVAEGLHAVRTDLFNTRVETSRPAGDTPGGCAVRLFTASDRLREVRGVAKEVKRLVLEEGIAPREIAIVVRDRERYEPLVREIFRDEEIATSLDERRSLADVPSVRAAAKVLEAAVSNRTRNGRSIPVSRLTSLLKTDYVSLSADARGGLVPARMRQLDLPLGDGGEAASEPWIGVDELENAVAFVGADLNLDDWLRRAARLLAWSSRTDRARGLRELELAAGTDESGADPGVDAGRQVRARDDYPPERLRQARAVLEEVGRIVLAIPYEAPASEIASAVRGALASLRLEQKLHAQARAAFPTEGELRRAALDLRGFEAFGRAIDAVVDASRLACVDGASEENQRSALTRAEFRSDLDRAISSQELYVAAATEGAVKVLAATDLRGLTFDTIFVLGLVEGEFPERARGDWIYPQHERETFKEMGLALEDLSPSDMLRKEEHYFYQVACRATERLVLCRPLAGEDGDETIMSYFVHECEKLAGARPLATVETLECASTAGELARALVRAECRARLGRPSGVSAEIVGALGAFAREARPGRAPIISPSVQRRIEIECVRDGEAYSEFDGLISSDALRAIVSDAYGSHTFSASELNVYGNCAFRFFLDRVLGLRPRVEAALDLQALDVGVLMHDILKRFFGEYRGRMLTAAPEIELAGALHRVANEVFDRFERGMPPLNPKLWAIERQTLLILLDRFLQDELDHQRRLAASAPVPRYFELAFGMPHVDGDPQSRSEPLVVERLLGGRTESINLRGQIDRVDVSPDGHVIAYDYKMSQGPNRRDMEAGRDAQLGIYLAALERLFLAPGEQIAGGGYYALRITPDRKRHGLYRSDCTSYTNVTSRTSALATREWEGLRARIEETIWEKFDSIRVGDFRVQPSLNELTCKHCDFPTVCRFDRYRIQLKRRAETRARLLAIEDNQS
jgi:ATP-dependent helicase/DNAse subunit B